MPLENSGKPIKEKSRRGEERFTQTKEKKKDLMDDGRRKNRCSYI